MDKFSDAARRRRRRELDEMRAVVSKAEARLLELTSALNKARSRVAAVRRPASADSARDFGAHAEGRRADAAEFENDLANIEIEQLGRASGREKVCQYG